MCDVLVDDEERKRKGDEITRMKRRKRKGRRDNYKQTKNRCQNGKESDAYFHTRVTRSIEIEEYIYIWRVERKD